jgi:WD40 repeat protein
MHNGPLLVFDSSSGELFSRQWINEEGTLQKLAFSPDGQWLAAGFTTGKVKIWRVDHLIHQD